MAPRFRYAPVVLALAALGCGRSGPTPVVVQGKVTFQSQPVTEGSVQFSDEKTGRGAEVVLKSDGTYEATMLPGEYAVVVLPPLVSRPVKDTMPDMQFKKVRNIPVKYHSTTTSGLSAAVRADKAVHDFDLNP